MAEYIEREAAVESFMGEFPDAHYPSWYAEKLKEIPAADVVEVRRGEWVDGHCTECGEEAMYSTFDEAIYDYDWEENLRYSHTETHVEYHLTDYCPHCGAKMDGGANPMRETKIYCDHCGKELNEMHDYPEQEIGFVGYKTADLCNECLEELDKLIKAYCKEGGEG